VDQVEYGWGARAQADSLPPAGRRALADAIEQLRLATWPVGDEGLVVYLIRDRQATIVLLDLIWAGP
jgi:hypothetical protein